MRRMGWAIGLAAMALFSAVFASNAGAESAGPACVRARIGSTGVCATLSWYVGVAKAVEDRDLQVGIRLTLSQEPRGRSAVANLPLPEASWGENANSSGGVLAQAHAVFSTLAAYGMIAPGQGLQRFVGHGGAE